MKTNLSILACLWLSGLGPALHAQFPQPGEVRQIVTFSFTPGGMAQAVSIFEELALPVYRLDEDMRTFRGFREIESSVPMNLMVVSSFNGMAGMDRSNAALTRISAELGGSMGDFYGPIGALIASHTDQFVAMLPQLGNGDPSQSRRTAFIWYRILPGQGEQFERALATEIVPWETASGIPASTGRVLLSDGYHYLRILGFDSLGDYQSYWETVVDQGYERIARLTAERRDIIVTLVPSLSVR